jgi:hypothetical protein
MELVFAPYQQSGDRFHGQGRHDRILLLNDRAKTFKKHI